MEGKKLRQNSQNQSKTVKTPSPVQFVGDIKTEFNKISWTSREELKTYTQIVVGATFIMGLSIYAIDLLIQGALTGLGNTIRLITG